ncbi:MFS transporter [Acerihabitans sp. KWT182]|uniref:MFS transporter n=1 Tax=Acerihabitans sp. KWT182 TaxID=3157919 RepID=A0AAU7Q672_9GAMM
MPEHYSTPPMRPIRKKPRDRAQAKPPRLTLASFGGASFILVIFAYLTQGMLFWGITLWIPMAVKSIGFTGMGQAVGSALPYLAAVALAIPMAYISDKTGKRILIAALGMLIPGVLLLLLPALDNGYARLALITLAMGYYASSFTPNIWSIIQSNVQPHAIGAASGIVNGVGAGGGGTLAGLMVARIYTSTGSYMSAFMVLGGLVVLGGLSLLLYGRIRRLHSLGMEVAKA